jgi:hypothetical protein
MKNKTMTITNDPNGIEAPIDAPRVTPEQMLAAAAVVATIIIIIVLIYYGRAGSGISQVAPGVANSVAASMSVADIASLIR